MVHGRLLIVERAAAGWPQAHIAKAMGLSHKCVKTWLDRHAAEGLAGLADRSSRPRSTPTRTSVEREARVLRLRREHRRGPDWIAVESEVPARTVSRVLARHGEPRLADLDPTTGQLIRSSKATTTLVDDHSRLTYSEILPDEKGPTCAAFLNRAADYFAAHGITGIERLMTDNAWSYRWSLREACTARGIKQASSSHTALGKTGKVERLNRTLQTEWAYWQIFTSNDQRSAALAPRIEHYNTKRRHSALGGLPPVSRLPT